MKPIEKRCYLARFFTNFVSVTFFTKHKRGDEEKSELYDPFPVFMPFSIFALLTPQFSLPDH